MDSVMIVGKGPSAAHAWRWCREGDAIAVINDAAKLIPGRRIDYAFFSDAIAITEMMADRHRITSIISRRLDLASVDYIKAHPETTDWIHSHNWISYADTQCEGSFEAIAARILTGGIAHHHTLPGAIHYLAKVERAKHIRVIGMDGGERYAPGVKPLLTGEGIDLTQWAEITRRLAKILHDVYGTTFEWWTNESDHPGENNEPASTQQKLAAVRS